MTLNLAYDYNHNGGKLPGFFPPSMILADALDVLSPEIDLTPSECADEYRVIDGIRYDSRTTPYIVEPSNMSISRRYKAVCYVGTVQSGKTTGLIENLILHRMICDPCDVHVTQMDKESAGRYSRGKIEKMIRECGDLRDRLIARGDTLGNVFNKEFKGNASLTIGWPVASQLASRDIPLMLTTDRDRIGDNIDNEGDILPMMQARNTRFMSRGMSVCESSPGREVTDETWAPSTIHEAPPCSGILAYYNNGTRGRYYWTCPHCGGKFEPEFKHLRYDEKGTPIDRGRSAYLVCPLDKCGGIIEQGERHELNQPENGAGWLHEHRDGKSVVPIGHPDIRQADYATYWQKGCHAAYQTWGDMVSEYLAAEHTFENTGEEKTLKTVWNTRIGLPYLPRNRATSIELSGAGLLEAATFRELGIAPSETAFITISVDVQPSRFVVGIDAWGRDLERWLVDRYDIATPPADSPGADRRGMQTNIYFEDWQALEDLHDKVIPVEGSGFGLKPLVIIIDSAGATGTTAKAYKFWKQRRKQGLSKSYYLYKGVGGENIARAKHREPENQQGGKRKNRDAVKIVFTATNRLKDEIMTSLVREEIGPDSYHLPNTLPQNIFDEFCAERREADGWVKKPGQVRNESLDLAVMGKAAVIVRGGEKINWDRPPAYALKSLENSLAVKIDDDGNPIEVQTVKATSGASLAKARAGFVKNR